MMLPAPQWFAWIYAILFWIFALGCLSGKVEIVGGAFIGLLVMFMGLAMWWIGRTIIDIYRDIRR